MVERITQLAEELAGLPVVVTQDVERLAQAHGLRVGFVLSFKNVEGSFVELFDEQAIAGRLAGGLRILKDSERVVVQPFAYLS